MMYYANNFIHKRLMNEDIFNVDFFWSCLLLYKVTLVDILFYWIFEIKKYSRHISKGRFFLIHRSELTKNWSISSLTRLD